jgi:hypothetical protein
MWLTACLDGSTYFNAKQPRGIRRAGVAAQRAVLSIEVTGGQFPARAAPIVRKPWRS